MERGSVTRSSFAKPDAFKPNYGVVIFYVLRAHRPRSTKAAAHLSFLHGAGLFSLTRRFNGGKQALIWIPQLIISFHAAATGPPGGNR